MGKYGSSCNDGLRGIDYSKDAGNSSEVSDPVFNCMQSNENWHERANKARDDYFKMREEFKQIIAELEPANIQSVLTLRYLNFYEWTPIIHKMKKSRSKVMKMHSAALLAFYEKYFD